MKYLTFDFYVSFSDVIASTKKGKSNGSDRKTKRDSFASEPDNDAFIAELTEMWQNWSGPPDTSKISEDINKKRDNPMRITAFVTIDGKEAFLAFNELS